jgi:hypothetical protein
MSSSQTKTQITGSGRSRTSGQIQGGDTCCPTGGMRYTSTAVYSTSTDGASKKTLHKHRVTFGNIIFQISYSLDYYLRLSCSHVTVFI